MEKGPVLKTRLCGLSDCVAGGRSGKSRGGFWDGPAAGLGNCREDFTLDIPAPSRQELSHRSRPGGWRAAWCGRAGGERWRLLGPERDMVRFRVQLGCSPFLLSWGTRAARALQAPENKHRKAMVVAAGLEEISVFKVSPQSVAQIPMGVSGATGDVPRLTEKDTGFPPVPQPMSKTSQHSCK